MNKQRDGYVIYDAGDPNGSELAAHNWLQAGCHGQPIISVVIRHKKNCDVEFLGHELPVGFPDLDFSAIRDSIQGGKALFKALTPNSFVVRGVSLPHAIGIAEGALDTFRAKQAELEE